MGQSAWLENDLRFEEKSNEYANDGVKREEMSQPEEITDKKKIRTFSAQAC